MESIIKVKKIWVVTILLLCVGIMVPVCMWPVKVVCGVPEASCTAAPDENNLIYTNYDIEPRVVKLIEGITGKNFFFKYMRDYDVRTVPSKSSSEGSLESTLSSLENNLEQKILWQDVENVPIEQWTVFDGKYITGRYPPDWEIREYVDWEEKRGQVYDDLEMEGLTGITVLLQGQEVFRLSGVYAWGGIGWCRKYYKFADFSEEDFERVRNNIPPLESELYRGFTVIELKDALFAEFDLLGARVRRVQYLDPIYTVDTVPGNDFFEADCFDGWKRWVLPDVSFTNYVDGDIHDYMWYISDEMDDEGGLQILDQILDSLEVK